MAAEHPAEGPNTKGPKRWRPGPAHVAAGVALLTVLVALPPLAAILVQHVGPRGLGVGIIVASLATLLLARPRLENDAALWRLPPLAATGLGATALVWGTETPILLLPGVVYVTLGAFFISSLLWTDSVIERAARALEPQAPDFIRGYCRTLTAVWAVLFFLNAGIITSLALTASHQAWLSWTTFGNWAFMAGFSAAEFLFRKSWFRYYFYGGRFDQLWSRLFPSEATERGRRSAAYIQDIRASERAAPFPGLWTASERTARRSETSSTGRPLLAHWGRVLRTGSAFLLFGAASLVLAALAPLIARRKQGDQYATSMQIQAIVHRFFRAFVLYMKKVGILTVEIRGGDLSQLARGRIIVANHPTLLDVVLLVAQLPQADCVVKREAWSNPVLRGAVTAAGYIPNDEGQELLDACSERLSRDRTLLLFPEGTRSPRDGLGPFRRGAAHIALAASRDLLPVRIHCDPPTLMRGQKWYDVPVRAMTYTLDVETPISSVPYRRALEAGEARGRVVRRMTAAIKDVFQGEENGSG